MDYVISVEAQSITAEAPGPEKLAGGGPGHLGRPDACSKAWGRRSTPARGCSCTARRATANRRWPSGSRVCFGQEIWIPHAIYEDGQIIKFYDSAYHKQVLNDERQHHQVRRARSPLAEDLPSHGGRRRRTDDGQSRAAPRPAQQHQRSPAADEEQLRLPADRRFRPAADRARRTC